jgi:hypothetical protein
MHATVGDRILIRGKTVETPDRHGEIIELRGESDGPPYLVRFENGHESVVYPGTDFVVERAAGA